MTCAGPPLSSLVCRAETGETYSLGPKGLLAWAGLLVVLLGVGINLVVSTSALGQ